MRIHFIRHAKAKSSSSSGHDIHRDLSNEGQKQVVALVDHLKIRIENIDVWCSTANRTSQTLDVLGKTITFKSIEHFDDLYLCSKATFMEHLWASDSSDDLVIIAHNFGISDIVSYFSEEPVELRTSEYVCLDFGDLSRAETSRGTGTIVDRYRPFSDPF
ncbi:MAG: histidine phosphatase family protein [Crocinitomicaceae bacterium]|nr:histidine phosphatase family protein [Crocinitomicaceae bacterium]